MEKLYIMEGKRRRPATLVKCDNCGKEFLKQTRFIKEGSKNYCNRKCSSEGQKNGKTLVCPICGEKFYRPKSKILLENYCSAKCKDESEKNSLQYRKLALREKKNECERCGYDNILALDVHHKDHNRENNSLDNLEILCANCHVIGHRVK